MARRTIHLIPHVHWDREWYLTRSQFTARLVPMLDQVLDLLESAPALRWHLDGQMILVEDYLAVVPGARGTIEALVRRGQLGLGPWYVLADELMPSGVSLAKNLEIGIALARDLGGEAPVLYSPDAFGHPAGLPSLAARFGIRWATVWRGAGRADLPERDLFRWHDGETSVLTYRFPPQGYEAGIDLAQAGDRLAAVWAPLRRQLIARAETPEIAVPVGADHHAPEPTLVSLAERLQALEPDAEVRFSGWAEYFRAAESHRADLGTRRGELRDSAGVVWSLQGVHSTRSRLKGRYSAAEARLITAAGLSDGPVLQHAWRALVQAQFHDTLAGCCADAVADEQNVRLAGVAAVAGETVRHALERRAGHDPDLARANPGGARPALVVWNPDRREFSGVVIAETTWFDRDVLVGPPGDREPREGLGYRSFHLTGPAGDAVPVQVLRVEPGLERIDGPRHYPDLDQVDRVWVAAWLDRIPGRQAVVYRVGDGSGPAAASPAPVRVSGRTLRNELLSAELGPAGLLRLTDHATGAEYDGLLEIECHRDRGDLYTPDVDERSRWTARAAAGRPLAAGPLLGALESRWTIRPAGGSIRGRTVIALEAGRGHLSVRIEFDNQATDHRLRVRLPLGGVRDVVAGAPFGAERRGVGRLDRSWPEEATLPTAPAHGFVESADPARPFRLERTGCFEYQLGADGSLAMTLCRSVGTLSRADGANRRGHAGWAMPTPGAQEPGRHVIEFAVGARPGAFPHPLVPAWLRTFTPRPDRPTTPAR